MEQKKEELLIQRKNVFLEYNKLVEKINLIDYELDIIKEKEQNNCDHEWILEKTSGPYPDKIKICSKCSITKAY